MVRLKRAQFRMRMLLERPDVDAAAVEDLTIAIRSPDPEVRFAAVLTRCAAYCSLNDPVSMLRDFADAGRLLAAHRPLIQPLLPDYDRYMTEGNFRNQGQRNPALLMMYLMHMLPKQLAAIARTLDPMCPTDCQRLCRAVEAAKSHLAGAKAHAGQPVDASIARAKERGGNAYRWVSAHSSARRAPVR